MRGFGSCLLLLGVFWFTCISTACIGWTSEGECPEIPGPVLEDLDDDEVLRKKQTSFRAPDEGPAHPNSGEDIYLEVVSKDLVRLIYEREGQMVVETYEVGERYRE